MWNPDVDPKNRVIEPKGLPLAVIVVSSIFLILSIILTGVRSYVRATEKIFGWDDGLMVGGCISYAGATVVTIWAELIGIGTLDIELNHWQFEESKKIHTAWLLVYVVPMTLVKASICVTLLRIADTKRALVWVVYVLLGITCVSFVAAFVGTLLQCQPIEAQWKTELLETGEGRCADILIFVALGYIATVCTIVTDATLVVVPALVLWKANMKTQTKLQVFSMLSVGSVASIITMVRIPFVQRYSNIEDQHYWIATIVLCSMIETGIGMVASSLPAARRLLKWRKRGSTVDSEPTRWTDLVTFGSKPIKGSRGGNSSQSRFRNPTDKGISLSTVQARNSENGNWTRLDDDGSDRGAQQEGKGIRAEYSYGVDLESATSASKSQRDQT